MDLEIFERLESNVRGYIRSFPVVFEKAQGAIMTTEDGKEYIDFFAGAGTLNYGHNNPALKQKLIEYIEADGVVHSLDMASSAKKRLLETIDRVLLQPRKLSYKLQFTGPTGANAVEAALKLARLVKQRTNVIAFTHAYHGHSIGALAATANTKFRSAAGITLGNITFMPYEGYLGADFDTLGYLETLLDDPSSGLDKPAAVIVETIQAEGGINVASDKWLQGLEKLCRSHDMLLIIDDIQVGCGRTGTFFSFEPAGISPDIITLSKSISGFGLPMSLVMIKPEFDIWKPSAHTGTFRGNNLAFVCGAEALELYWATDELATEVGRKAKLVQDRLTKLVQAHPKAKLAVRGRGLIQGLVSEADPTLAGRVAAKAFTQGLVIETAGAQDEVLKLLPPLTIEDEVLSRGLDIIDKSLAESL